MQFLNAVLHNRLRFSLLLGLMALVGSGLITWIRTADLTAIPLIATSSVSIASLLTEITFVSSLLVTGVCFRRFNRLASTTDPVLARSLLIAGSKWVARLSALLGIGFVLTFMTALAFAVLVTRVPYFVVGPEQMTPLAALYGGLLSFLVAYATSTVDNRELLTLAAAVMTLGIGVSILLAPDISWWTGALSFLGTDEFGVIFNLSFILAGLILLVVLMDKTGDLDVLRHHGAFQSPYLGVIRLGFLALCVNVVGIGLFPYKGATLMLHQIAGTASILLFIVFAPSLGYLVPIYPAAFKRLSLAVALLCVVALTAYALALVNFTLMELILLALIAFWLVFFYNFTRVYIVTKDPTLITE